MGKAAAPQVYDGGPQWGAEKVTTLELGSGVLFPSGTEFLTLGLCA